MQHHSRKMLNKSPLNSIYLISEKQSRSSSNTNSRNIKHFLLSKLDEQVHCSVPAIRDLIGVIKASSTLKKSRKLKRKEKGRESK